MSVNHQLDTDAPRPVGDRLLESLRQWRDADLADGPELLDHELRAIDAHRPVIEHAKGALMLRYGIDSYQAFAVLVHWARVTHTPVHTVAHTLVHGICEGSPRTEALQGPLMRWMENRLRVNDPDPAGPSEPPTWSRTGG